MRKEIIAILKDNNGKVELKESLTIKLTPHTPPVKVVSIELDKTDIFYTDKEGRRQMLFIGQPTISNSIYQRLQILKLVKKEIK